MSQREVGISDKTPQKEISMNKMLAENRELKYCKYDDGLKRPNNDDTIIKVLNRIQLSGFNSDSPDAFNSFRYYNNSECWPETDINSLEQMVIKALNISHKIFKWYVDIEHILLLETLLGCKIDELQFNTTKKPDEYISYFMSTLHGENVYFCRYLGIEYVFTKT